MPWTMWGGPFSNPGTRIGNIKFGPKEIVCPDRYKVVQFLLICHGLGFNEKKIKKSFIMLQ